MPDVLNSRLEDLFLTVAGADASGTVTKADMVRRCAREADADIVVMIGDCPQDLEGARQAGAEFIAAAYGYGLPPGKCKEEGIPYVLSPRDIPAEVGRTKCRNRTSRFGESFHLLMVAISKVSDELGKIRSNTALDPIDVVFKLR